MDSSKQKKAKKRKIKDDDQSSPESESPSSKFKRLDLSQIGSSKKTERKAQKQTNVESSSKSHHHAMKRKSNMDSDNKAKKSKMTQQDNINDASDDDDFHEPSHTELQQAVQPENTPNIETTRKKKKAKHQKLVEIAKEDSAQREMQRNAEYLRKWKYNRSEWKFEKLRQISIQNHLFIGGTTDLMDDYTWDLTIEYLAGTKGAGRDLIVTKAEDIINSIDSRITNQNKDEMVKLTSYNRARELLQILQ